MCKFRHRVVASTFCLEKHSPKGSCHLDESSMNHTLAQNNLCEFWCGMHLTCKKHSIKPDRKSMKTRSEKNLEVCISTSLLDANRSLPDIKFGLKIVWKRHAGSWLSRLPLTKKSENCRYVFTGTLQRLPWPLTAMFPSGPLLEMKWDNATKNQGSLTLFPCQKKHEEWPGKIGSRSFTSFQMVHTHTCSEQSLRILMWNATDAQKHQQ